MCSSEEDCTLSFLLKFVTLYLSIFLFFFFNDTATTEIYTLSLHDALPISQTSPAPALRRAPAQALVVAPVVNTSSRSEEHTSELQSPCNLVCRLLLEKKKIHLLSVAVRQSKR